MADPSQASYNSAQITSMQQHGQSMGGGGMSGNSAVGSVNFGTGQGVLGGGLGHGQLGNIGKGFDSVFQDLGKSGSSATLAGMLGVKGADQVFGGLGLQNAGGISGMLQVHGISGVLPPAAPGFLVNVGGQGKGH